MTYPCAGQNRGGARGAAAGDSSKDAEEQAAELGDLLFAVVNASRFIHADPEEALARTNRKFKKRFAYIEEQLRISGRTFEQTDLIEMDSMVGRSKAIFAKIINSADSSIFLPI